MILLKKKNYSLKSEDLKEQIQERVRNYDNINHSSISNNAILVIDEEEGKKTQKVGKILLRCWGKEH